ncbi:hypothetical protein BDV33DRAFT_174284 [Aspergillus novoparasiticus]|uniref:Secreted protein n=1 Tax=Aspergillus novoparasiticus TaxID=986946 RepID=A0A5N6ENN5_9EURO|nr:hypothetical protein BDV33DRAFT_174284 [Aspergillus novoparasiticus]
MNLFLLWCTTRLKISYALIRLPSYLIWQQLHERRQSPLYIMAFHMTYRTIRFGRYARHKAVRILFFVELAKLHNQKPELDTGIYTNNSLLLIFGRE